MLTFDVTRKLAVDGYVVINEHLPEIVGIAAFSSLGKIVRLPRVDEVQTLVPRHAEDAPLNTYSGNFGIQEFPLHTDLAHWFLPPRYFALRCVVGSRDVSTSLVDVKDLIQVVGRMHLLRALVRPRRPLQRTRTLMRLLSRREDGSELFRWDSLFVVPATNESQEVCETVVDALASIEPINVFLENPGDTLILDNWRLLHGRSQISRKDELRRVERAYFGAIC